jgi:hypothetical protein
MYVELSIVKEFLQRYNLQAISQPSKSSNKLFQPQVKEGHRRQDRPR